MGHLQAVHQFARWLADNGRIDRSPFTRLKPLNASLDARRRRGELTPDEVGNLLATTIKSATTIRDLTGSDRVMLYRTALGTGFGADELGKLAPEHFDLMADPPAVILSAKSEKNRKGALQPLPVELAADSEKYLAGRPNKTPVWRGTWHERAADMLRIDLQAAGIPVEVDGPEGTETRDFHALRACYISNVIRTGADLKQAMTLARHSDPRLTAKRYARTRLHDLGTVVNKLPDSTGKPIAQPHQVNILRRTGTDSGCTPDVPRDVPAIGFEQGGLRIVQETDCPGEHSTELQDDQETEGNKGDLGQPGTIKEKRGKRPRPDSNRGITVLQTAALPLGYEATNTITNHK